MPLEHYAVVMYFCPKGEESGDGMTACTREVADARPLALMNADRKTSAAVLNHICAKVFAASLHEAQSGFIRGRSFLNNVVDLDAHWRIASQEAAACPLAAARRPGLAPRDYAAAFPPLSQNFMHQVLKANRAPEGSRSM